jgi:hypothetical protein
MAGGLRFRSEATLVSSKAAPLAIGTTVLIPASQVVGIQRVGVYRCILQAISAQATFQFQDTTPVTPNVLSATYTLALLGFFILDTPINGDPWWQAGPGVGLQILTTGGTVAADIYAGFGA